MGEVHTAADTDEHVISLISSLGVRAERAGDESDRQCKSFEFHID